MEFAIHPPKVFVDSSVLFAAVYSGTGSARDLLLTAVQGHVLLVFSGDVLDETERNLLARAPRAHADFLLFRDNLPYELSQPANSLVADTMRVVVAKDAPIVAAARAVGVALIATYDRKHLLSKRQEIFDAFGITVARPDDILADLDGGW